MTFRPNPFPGKTNGVFFNPVAKATHTPKTNPPPFRAKAAGTNGSLVVLIVDESGSMSYQRNDTIGGIQSFIEDQNKDDIPTKILVNKFQGSQVTTMIDMVDVNEVLPSDVVYSPGASTNLHDAIGLTLSRVNDYLATMKKKDRPSVIVQIITDGEENSSKTYNLSFVKKMIADVGKKNWLVGYIGANVDAFAESSSLGINQMTSSGYNASSTASAYSALNASVLRAKASLTQGNSLSVVASAYFTDDEKKKLNEVK